MNNDVKELVSELLSSTDENRESIFNKLLNITSDNPKNAYAAYLVLRNHGIYETAVSMLKHSAEMNYSKAKVTLAWELCNGFCIQKDYNKALELAEPYAEEYAFAGNLVGSILINLKREKEAVKYLLSASQKGNSDASYNIAYLLITGCGEFTVDYDKALGWLELSVEQGGVRSCEFAALYYLDNNRIDKARKYINLGCERGCEGCFELRKEISYLTDSNPFFRIKDNDIHMSKYNSSKYGVTGMKKYTEEQDRIEEERRRETRKNALICAAGFKSEFPELETISEADIDRGSFITCNGKFITVDDCGNIFTDKGITIFDNDVKMAFGDEGTAYFTDDMSLGWIKR